MKRLFIIFLVLGTYYQLAAQELLSGFIVTLKGDTVKGLLINATDAELNSKITFQNSVSGDNKIQYRPADLLSFGFDYGRTFIRFPRTNTPAEGDSLFVFAKKILEGRINLYTYTKKNEKSRPDIFLVNNYSGRSVHLIEPEKFSTTDRNGVVKIGESFRHLGLIRIVKGDSDFTSTNVKNFGYSVKAIREDISKYNKGFKDFPRSQYKPRAVYSYNVVAGIPFVNTGGDVSFRLAFYRNKYFPESSRVVSIIMGISYQCNRWTNPISGQNRKETTMEQWLSVIPIGVNLQIDSRFIKPYVYIGAGLAFGRESHSGDNSMDNGKRSELFVTPTANMGIGMRIKIGSNFLVTELSPAVDGGFINLGYSF